MSIEVIEVADLTPELLAALKSAQPEQVGDDLVLRLADGRVYFIDGFFAQDEKGDGLPPVEGAIPLSPEIAALLLGETDMATAAGDPEEAGTPPNTGANFAPFADGSPEGQGTGDVQTASLDAGKDDTANDGGRNGGTGDLDRKEFLYSQEGTDGQPESNGTGNPGPGSVFPNFGSGFLGNSGYGAPLSFSSGAISIAAGPGAGGGGGHQEFSGGTSLSDGGFGGSVGPSFGGWSLTPLVKEESLLLRPAPYDFAGLAEFSDLADASRFLRIEAADVAAAGGLVTVADTSRLVIFGDPQAWSLKGTDPQDSSFVVYEATFDNAVVSLRMPAAMLQPLDWVMSIRQSISDWSAGLHLWITDPDFSGIHRNDVSLQAAKDPSQAFSGDDIIFGSGGNDILDGYAGNDIVVGLGGIDVLSGGDGNDIIIVQQPDSFGTADHTLDGFTFETRLGKIDGGAGRDTLSISVIDGSSPVDFRLFRGDVQSIEVLSASFVQGADPSPVYVFSGHGNVVEFGSIDVPAIILDAATVGSMGGDLTVDMEKGILLLADATHWTQTAQDAEFVHYQTILGGEIINLSVSRKMVLPINLSLTGDDSNNFFCIFGRTIQHIDGGAGNDIVTGFPQDLVSAQPGLDYGLGTLDYSNPGTVQFSNIEGFSLAACEEIRLSAAAILAMTDARKTLLVETEATITLTDADHWKVDRYISTLDSSGAVSTVVKYVSTDGATLLVQSGHLPAVADEDGLQFWHIQHGGNVGDFPVSAALSVIDLGNGANNMLTISASQAASLAGPDHVIDIVGDRSSISKVYHDVVAFSDPEHWLLLGVERGTDTDFYIYRGTDQDGHSTDLRVATYLEEPVLLPQSSAGDDILRIADVVPGGIDGGGGFDVLQLLAAGGTNLSVLDPMTPRDIEALDLRNGQVSSVFLSAESIGRMAGGETFYVIGDHEGGLLDGVYLKDGANWKDGGLHAGQNGDPDFHIYQADAVVDGKNINVTLAVDNELNVVLV